MLFSFYTEGLDETICYNLWIIFYSIKSDYRMKCCKRHDESLIIIIFNLTPKREQSIAQDYQRCWNKLGNNHIKRNSIFIKCFVSKIPSGVVCFFSVSIHIDFDHFCWIFGFRAILQLPVSIQSPSSSHFKAISWVFLVTYLLGNLLCA